jgi:hypothetical protein
MTPSILIRPVLVCFAAAALTACGAVESDPHRFETMADAVAAIPLDDRPAPDDAAPAPEPEPRPSGLRPALKVEVLDPHALWDARDGLVEKAAVAAAPAVAEAVVRQASDRIEAASVQAGLRPAVAARTAAGPRPNAGLVQLGAYSSEAAAHAAWARLRSGEAAWALDGLSPVYEAVEVDGRTLTRLKVRAPASGAAAVCAAARIDDPWCHRAA